MSKKTALITGVTGQDGSYLAEFLLKKDYTVAGIVRKTSNMAYANISHIQEELQLVQADLLDPISIREALQKVKPDEVYNLASQSHPAESFRQRQLVHTGFLMQHSTLFLNPSFIRPALLRCLVG